MRPRAPLCALGLFYTLWGSCARPPSSVCAPFHPYTPPLPTRVPLGFLCALPLTHPRSSVLRARPSVLRAHPSVLRVHPSPCIRVTPPPHEISSHQNIGTLFHYKNFLFVPLVELAYFVFLPTTRLLGSLFTSHVGVF
jgi:hypothetical protein